MLRRKTSACLAILSSSVPKTKLGFALGTMQGGLTAGGVIGPLVGGILAEAFGMRATFSSVRLRC